MKAQLEGAHFIADTVNPSQKRYFCKSAHTAVLVGTYICVCRPIPLLF